MSDNNKEDTLKGDIFDKTLGLTLKSRTVLVATAGVLENAFTFAVFCYLKIWPMVAVTAIGLIAFIICARYVGKVSFSAIHVTVLIYSVVAVLVVSFYAEWAYGFQNYLFVPVQLCFALVYKKSNFKTVLKYAAVTIVLMVITYIFAMNICFRMQPYTGASINFIIFVNIVNAFFVFVLNSIVLINLFIELFNETNALNAANRQLVHYADRDPLTNLYNRRFAEKKLKKLTAGDPPLSIILCDLDNFKVVNDTLGHAAGDLVLDYVAKVILGNINYMDFAIRWGGEEFLLIINNSDVEVAHKTMERIMSQLRDSRFLYEGKPIKTTLTAGIALFTPGEDEVEDIIKTADRRMYMGKQAGRNRYVTES